jgi:hypothetical protein
MRSDTPPEYIQALARTPAGGKRSIAVTVCPGKGGFASADCGCDR